MKNIFHSILKRRHFWRYASFSEIAELYTSRTLRVVAVNLSAGFTSIYLYKTGYSLATIFLFWIVYYLYRLALILPVAKFVAHYGPKHTIFVSNILYIPAAISLSLVPSIGPPAIITWGLFTGVSMALYVIAYMVSFSKIKNVEHSGREIGYMAMLEKIASALSPVIGGAMAVYFGPQVVMWTSAVIIAISAVPLMSSSEPTRTHQKLDFKGFPWRLSYQSFKSEVAVGFDAIAASHAWGLFLTVTIFSTAGGFVYLDIGSIAAVSVVVGLLVSFIYGRMVDSSKGKQLLFYSTLLNSVTHSLRPFVGNIFAAVGVNFASETAITGVNFARLKGVFDIADQSGHRIIFLMWLETFSIIGAMLACLVIYLLLTFLSMSLAFTLFYLITAFIVLIIATTRFPVYEK